MTNTLWLRILLLAILISTHRYFLHLVNTIVSEPYLDEIFHVPQAQRYWEGKFGEWDPKITTPPGVYLWSLLVLSCRRVFENVRPVRGNDSVNVGDWNGQDATVGGLRWSNAVLLYVLVGGLMFWSFVRRNRGTLDRVISSASSTSSTTTTQTPSTSLPVLPREFITAAFPLFFFFSGLYYTDLFSALTVVLTYAAWEAGIRQSGTRRYMCQILHLLFGLLSLASRQTNVFWVAVFLGGLQVIESAKARAGEEVVHDVDVGWAWFEDYIHLIISLISNCTFILPGLVLDLWPQLSLLFSFAAFVYWNQGVVLGDKSNHVATIHTPQLLYIWPFITFFSWPVMVPRLLSLLGSQRHRSLPRPQIVVLLLVLVTASVHFNTIVHPFTLADNRHYTFYVFRILVLRRWWVKYTAVPVYVLCAWLVLNTLSSDEEGMILDQNEAMKYTDIKYKKSSQQLSAFEAGRDQQQERKMDTRVKERRNTVKSSFVLIWLSATILSVITAPLVEPRYYIVPWLIWRMHVPDNNSQSQLQPQPQSQSAEFDINQNSNSNSPRSSNQTEAEAEASKSKAKPKLQNKPNRPSQQTTQAQTKTHETSSSTSSSLLSSSKSSPPPPSSTSSSSLSSSLKSSSLKSSSLKSSSLKSLSSSPPATQTTISMYVELLWYTLINIVTITMFLYRGFQWPQEPGQIQRFMW